MYRCLSHAAFILLLAAGVAACDSSPEPRGPLVGPSPVPEPPAPQPSPNPPPAGISIAGNVTDAAWRPLSGARVEVVNGPDAGRSALTDGNGDYRLSGKFDETTQFRASKDGHADATVPLPAACARCNPNWWIFFALESRAAHADLSGRYELTFTAADSCAGLPEELRRRTYDATLTPYEDPHGPGSRYTVAVSAPAIDRFNTFLIGVAGDYLSFWLGDLHGSPGIAEQLGENTFMGIGGMAQASIGTSNVSHISATFDGVIDACELGTPSERLSCQFEATLMKGRCEAHLHRITLTRR
jgi:Carboxypeptidase regulatory-like domain